MSFTTTMRNPERIKNFINIIMEFEGKILTNELINKIIFKIISKKLYIPTYVEKTTKLKKQLIFENKEFNEEETLDIIRNSSQNHKEAGFDFGWPSRFDTWYKIMKEFGFIYYEIGKPIELSDSDKKLVKALEKENINLEQQVFLNALVKYQRNNPFRRVLNENIPLVLLLKTIIGLKENIKDNPGISIKELSLLICWPNSDYKSLVNLIINLRRQFKTQISDEIIYEECKKVLKITDSQEKKFKLNNILYELPDEFVRKMKSTGLFSIRGYGKFIDVNSNELNKINYILKNILLNMIIINILELLIKI
ncbi:AlwI family type II restriction endonuclease [Spiroplasma sp. SV19]|uniref:AlwI family type II restriction endonuclease n=1 Tax=Spiroplasma sp. SV19 TaxID=2570468 RepID=UPI0024B69A25|nr:AlwI family type II restriction endonuclease [Spiroplasma sp. SV19]